MHRTTISLPDDLAAKLEREARRSSRSVAAVARAALAEHFKTGRRKLPFEALGRSGKGDVAERSEEILSREWSPDRRR